MLSHSVIKFPNCFKSGWCCKTGRGTAERGTQQRALTTEYLLALHTPGASTSWAVRWCYFKGSNTLLASSHCHVWILASCKFCNVDQAWGSWEEYSNTEKTCKFHYQIISMYSFKTSLSLQSP